MSSLLVLDSTTKSIEAILGAPVATNEPEFATFYADATSSTFVEAEADGVLNGTTAVAIVAAPAASTSRVIREISVYNNDTAPVVLTIQVHDSSDIRRLITVTLPPSTTWRLTDPQTVLGGSIGDFVGPSSSVIGDLVSFAGVTGKVGADSGHSASDFALLASANVFLADNRGTEFIGTRSGTITRDGSGLVSSIAMTGGRTITVSRDGSGYISSISDGTNTWTYTRDGNHTVTSWAVT